MSSETQPTQAPGYPDLGIILGGLLLMYIPTYILLDKTIWNIVGQGHGPVMLALTIWLAWQRWTGFWALPDRSSPVAGGVSLALGLALYIVGHSQDILSLDTLSQIFVLSGICLIYRGGAGLKAMWFPLFFMLFLVPIPGSIVDKVTGPLKMAVSYAAEAILYHLNYPIGRSGVTLSIGPYRLLVADACAGLNSIFALEAIGVFYMSVVQHTNKMRNILLATLIIPISFVSNVTRVIVLVLVTYYFGDEAGQGFIHNFAGILLFMVATALTIGTDSLLGLIVRDRPASPRVQGS
ncbi:MAG: exosortase B [Aquabacterium sp.]|uniref:exosortase B n=1 Tax=Aquabacterium sp. TaxID=1872578 RepID=UPI00122813C3|nr:exosortase B [Aquabacterium sp.]TAK85120.1 MAG: exosortase B [Aquabacterium sp.]